jgi:hypothetical protein
VTEITARIGSLTLRSDQRVGAIGRTRTGKTFAMERLLSDQKNVLVIDSKHRVQWDGYFLTYNLRSALVERKTIFRHGPSIPNAFWPRAVQRLRDLGGGVIYCDEMPVLTGPNRIPAGLADGFRLAGEIGVGIWWSAQESTGVNNTVMRQSEIVLLFANLGASDRDKVIKNYGDIGEVTAHLKPHQFVVVENYGEPYDADHIPVWKMTA